MIFQFGTQMFGANMYIVRLIETDADVASFTTQEDAQRFVVENWNLGPMKVVDVLTEEIVSAPRFLTEGA